MGSANEVNEATVDILKYLHEVKDKEKAQAIQMYVKWQYEISPEKWMTFRDEINMEIETAYKAKKISCVVKDRTGTEYIIDFKKMEEYEKSNPRKKYKIIRKDKAGKHSLVWTCIFKCEDHTRVSQKIRIQVAVYHIFQSHN